MDLRENELEKLEKIAESFATAGKPYRAAGDSYIKLESEYKDINSRLARVNEMLRNSLMERNRLAHFLNNILESLDSGVIVTDPSGSINVFNAAAEKLLGVKTAKALGQKYKSLLPLGADVERRALGLGEGERISGEIAVESSPGKKVHAAYSIGKLKRSGGDEKAGLVIILYNLTEIRILEDNLKRVSALAGLGEMAATVAHEIRNPLSGISGFTALLLRDLPADSEGHRLVEKISEGIESLDATVESLLAYTRSVYPDIEDVDVVSVVKGAVADLKAGQDSSGPAIEIKTASRRLDVRLDPRLFRMVVTNLLKNALQANPDGGKIRVKLGKPRGGGFKMVVEDDGPGIPGEALEKIFTPFYTTKATGTGLGLATVKKLTELHGGRVLAENRPSGGAAFVVEIPDSAEGASDEE
jgi:PAS domain S-box-containing protein